MPSNEVKSYLLFLQSSEKVEEKIEERGNNREGKKEKLSRKKESNLFFTIMKSMF